MGGAGGLEPGQAGAAFHPGPAGQEVPRFAAAMQEVPRLAAAGQEVPRFAAAVQEVPRLAAAGQEVPRLAAPGQAGAPQRAVPPSARKAGDVAGRVRRAEVGPGEVVRQRVELGPGLKPGLRQLTNSQLSLDV